MAGKQLPKGYRHAVSAGNSQARITFYGPLFSADANLTLRQNIRRMMQGIADEGAAVAKAKSPVGKDRPGHQGGSFRDGIVGRTQGVKGNKWALTAVVSQTYVYPWKSKGARGFVGRGQAEYRGGKVEARYRIFKSVTYQLRSARAVMAANLTKGLE